MRHFLFLVFLFCSWFAYGQETKVIPPSPEATSAFKFAEVPVSLYTGVTNTSIEIHQIKTKGVTVPVTVNYHSRGIKVEEISSRVGLGWALSYGGMVSRQVRGRADDHSLGLFWYKNYDLIFTDNNQRAYFYSQILNQGIDERPDQFFLDLNGESVKFIINHTDGEVLAKKFGNISISYTIKGGIIQSWKVVDAQGNAFFFGTSKDGLRGAYDFDVTESFTFSSKTYSPTGPISGEDDRSINTWHLMEIETPYGEKVEFDYEPETALSYRKSFDEKYYENPEAPEAHVKTHFSSVQSEQMQLTSISFNNGRLVFKPEAGTRQDLLGAKALDKIFLIAGKDTLKQFDFQQYYTTSTFDGNVLNHLYGLDSQSNKRMFLGSIQQIGLNGNKLPPYLFEYDPTVLPNRFSTSQDAWGYYNGKPNGHFLTFASFLNEINREVDTVKAQAGLLKQITYPSGGSVRFTYEHNVTQPPLHNESVLYPRINPTKITHMMEPFLKLAANYQNGEYVYPVTIGPYKNGLVSFDLNLPYCPPHTTDVTVDVPAECQYRVWLNGANNYVKQLYPQPIGNSFDIPAGNYTLVIEPPYAFNPDSSRHIFYGQLRWIDAFRLPETRLLYGGGKRIKKIEYFNVDSVIQVKEYEYKYGRSFGLPGFYYKGYTYQDPLTGELIPLVDAYGSVPGSPLSNLQGNTTGYEHVTEYFGDATKNHGKTEHTFTVLVDQGDYYKFPYPLPDDNEWLRGKPIAVRHYENKGGVYIIQKSIENYYKQMGQYELSNLSHFKYANGYNGPKLHFNHPTDSIPSFAKTDSSFVRPYLIPTVDMDNLFMGGNIDSIVWQPFYLSGGTVDLYKTIETDFYQDETRLEKVTNYFYDYSRHYQLARTETVDSQGRKLLSRTTYPLSIVSTTRTPAQQALVDQNRVAVPLITESMVQDASGMKLDSTAQRTRYRNTWSGKGSNFVMPQYVESRINDSGWQEEARYLDYDQSGNPLGVVVKHGPETRYLWDYAGSYPVAEVVHADASTFAYTSFEAESKGNWNFTGTIATDPESPTGTRYYQLTTSTSISAGSLPSGKKYVLTFWAKDGSVQVNSLAATPTGLTRNGWSYYKLSIHNTSSISISGSGKIDELRLYPEGVLMSTYTYDPLVGMTSATDPNGQSTYYEYDGFNRLQAVKDAQGNVLKTYQYHYKGQAVQ